MHLYFLYYVLNTFFMPQTTIHIFLHRNFASIFAILYCKSNGFDLNKKLSLSKNNNEIDCITCFKLSHSTLRRSGQMNGEVYWKNTGNSFIFVCPLHAAITDGEFIKQNIWNWSVFPSGGNMCWETLLLKPKSISRCGFVSYKCTLVMKYSNFSHVPHHTFLFLKNKTLYARIFIQTIFSQRIFFYIEK